MLTRRDLAKLMGRVEIYDEGTTYFGDRRREFWSTNAIDTFEGISYIFVEEFNFWFSLAM